MGRDALADCARKIEEIERTLPDPVRALASADGDGVDSPVFIRGSYKTPGPAVPRRFLEALSGAEPTSETNGSGRLELVG